MLVVALALPASSPVPWGSPAQAGEVQATESRLRQMAQDHPAAARLLPLGTSPRGNPILALEVRPQQIPLAQLPRCALICRQHGDEPESTAAGLQLAERLLAQDTLRLWQVAGCTATLIVPLANPDGAGQGTRGNGRGEDLNRDWGEGQTSEIAALQAALAGWSPHLVVDVHQWVPGDSCQTPLVEPVGGDLARQAAATMRDACHAHGFSLTREFFLSAPHAGLCHQYWGSRGVPALMVETRHRPADAQSQEEATRTTVVGLLRVLDLLAERSDWSQAQVIPYCGFESRLPLSKWYREFTIRVRSLDAPSIALLKVMASGRDREDFGARLARARVLLEVFKFAEAQETLRPACEERPHDAEAAFLMGAILFMNWRTAEATEWFAWARQCNPRHQGARLYLARCQEMLGHPDQARPLYESLQGRGTFVAYRRYAERRLQQL